MITTREINFYSHYVLLNGVEIGEIHNAPNQELVYDSTPWKLWIHGKQVAEYGAFIQCVRHVEYAYKKRLIAA